MNNGFLSQEEINSLLSGDMSLSEDSGGNELTQKEKDTIKEVGKTSMESAAKTLEMITGNPVKIESPVLEIITIEELRKAVELPAMSMEVKYISGIEGINLLINKTKDAQVIANLMMGGDGKVEEAEISEIEESAVSEAMNQMIGSSATTMSGVLGRSINISPPVSKIWKDSSEILLEELSDTDKIIRVSYKMTIGTLVDSSIVQLLSIETGKAIAGIMAEKDKKPEPAPAPTPSPSQSQASSGFSSASSAPAPQRQQQPVEVQQASFQPLKDTSSKALPKNIDLILDVPLDISVVLGRTKKSVKEILNLATGSLVELDKLAEEPVEVLVNGKTVALGEVVVVGENFGVRITSIVSTAEKIKSFS